MFVLEIKDAVGKTSRHYWMNSSQDDFLRYIPKNFGVKKDNVRAWVFSDEDFPLLEGLMKALDGKGVLDLSEDGKIKAGRIENDAFEVLAEYHGHEVEWPYSEEWSLAKPENGKFLGWTKKI
jgi:hypothetical protein